MVIRTPHLLALALCLLASSACFDGLLTGPGTCFLCGPLPDVNGSSVYAFVQNSGNGKWISGARVEIIEGADAGTSCITGPDHGHGPSEGRPGCLMGRLRYTFGSPRKIRVTKPGFRPRRVSVDVPGNLSGIVWEFTLTRKKQ